MKSSDVEAVILAAGYSTRAETFKMTLDFLGKPLLGHVIEAMQALCSRIIVVGGYQAEKIADVLKHYEKTELIYNETYNEGMFSSVKKGIQAVSAQRFFLTPGDYPLISQKICSELLNTQGDIIVPRFHNKGGHPILLSSQCIQEILDEPADSNLNKYLTRKGRMMVDVEEEGILMDLDTMTDYRMLLKHKCTE
ncbi:nucleotidyltransferase family protein [Cellulosilyticum sp. I15G10I2]|uniref:nucleotidyltransferase family protein n=1 Tax=Cellulosilyticum sp. I15G10I2 TaxID=1892843 RepID=UPI00085C8F93|nr:nucleotidyltransferase family protein [Cellulosilyticum sp. I15G10I2]